MVPLPLLESSLRDLVTWAHPPPRQTAVYEAMLSRPLASTLIICQLLCCRMPLLIFLAGLCVFAAVAMVLWAVLSLVMLGPVLLVTSFMGVSLWGWRWVLYGLVRWVNGAVLGGVLGRFWLPRIQGRTQFQDQSQGQAGGEEQIKGKDTDKGEKSREKKES